MEPERGRRKRKRLRGALSGKSGKAIGLTSLAAPLVGFIVNDLKKPDSVIRAFLKTTTRKLLERPTKKVEAIDISNKVDVLIDDTKTDQP
ncbi:MAG: hypothetical protein AB1744_10010 [Candidatus Zixiibacteriota bacterium]